MDKQLELSHMPSLPRWWDYLLDVFFIGYAFQPKHIAQAEVVGKRYCPPGRSSTGGGLGVAPMPLYIEEAWFLKVRTPHGTTEVECSEGNYDLICKGAVVPIQYQLHRLYVQHQQLIRGKLLC